MRRSERDTFDHMCFVKAWEYDAERFGWNYKLEDKRGIELDGWVMETNLKKA